MYINDIFQRKEIMGQRSTHPLRGLSRVKMVKKRFNLNEFMSVSQILSYFSRLSAMRKTSSKNINDDDLDSC